MKDDVKKSVSQKLGLSWDLKDAKIQTSIGDVRRIDGKISARFEVSGLPQKKNNGMYSDSYRTIPKIFDTIEQFSEYATTFFNASDDDIVKMCEGK